MVKRVIWIDDDESAMKAIIRNIFPELWDKDISSEIYIMGSYAPTVLNYEHDENSIKNVNRAVYDTFIDYLISANYINHEDDIRKKLPLLGLDNIDDNFLNEVRVASNKNDFIFQEETVSTCTEITPNSCEIAKKIIDAIKSENNRHNLDDTVIMLDLVLLDQDWENLQKHYDSNKEVVKVLSMGLYKELLNLLSGSPNQPSVMLYSTFVIPNDVISNWTNGYSLISGEQSDIVVYNRNGIPANKNDEKRLVDKIVSLGV